jgi:hypothetical protein
VRGGGKGRVWGEGGVITLSLYAHMNKGNKKEENDLNKC